jgi:integrase-like protein
MEEIYSLTRKYLDKDEDIMNEVKKETEKHQDGFDIELHEDGFKRFQGLIFIPKKMEEKIIERIHDDPREGHQGEARTLEKIQRYLYFPGMLRKIRRYINRCDKCHRGKIDTKKPFGLMTKWQHDLKKPWQHITMDFVHMPDVNGLGQILVVTDRFSKFTVLIPVKKTITVEEVYHLLWERIFAIFGTPETITSDRDKLFRSRKWLELTKNIGITQILSTANHQRTDGQT